jgi:hypothetical protein
MILNDDLAPVVLFIYNRPGHTRKTLEALSKNVYADKTTLYVFADGPKPGASAADLEKIEETRRIVAERTWCKEVHLINREINMNLEDNVIDGVTTIINQFGKIIVLEDDLITSPHFLKYCNEGLVKYQDDKQIFSVNGFMFPIDFDVEAETFLCPLATSAWGWATWANRWDKFEVEPKYNETIERNSFLSQRFNFANYNYLAILRMNTWDIRWYYTAFIRNGLGVFPTKSLVKNIGFDNSGTHSGNEQIKQELYMSPIEHKYLTELNIDFYAKFLDHFTVAPKKNPLMSKVKNKLGLILKFK